MFLTTSVNHPLINFLTCFELGFFQAKIAEIVDEMRLSPEVIFFLFEVETEHSFIIFSHECHFCYPVD